MARHCGGQPDLLQLARGAAAAGRGTGDHGCSGRQVRAQLCCTAGGDGKDYPRESCVLDTLAPYAMAACRVWSTGKALDSIQSTSMCIQTHIPFHTLRFMSLSILSHSISNTQSRRTARELIQNSLQVNNAAHARDCCYRDQSFASPTPDARNRSIRAAWACETS
jgi:hypothetical protein